MPIRLVRLNAVQHRELSLHSEQDWRLPWRKKASSFCGCQGPARRTPAPQAMLNRAPSSLHDEQALSCSILNSQATATSKSTRSSFNRFYVIFLMQRQLLVILGQ